MERRKQMFAKPYDLAQVLSGSPEKATRARTVPVLGPNLPPVPETAQRLTEPQEPRTLVLDIECSPNLGYMWNVWRTDITSEKLLETQEMLCFAASWMDEDNIFWASQYHHGSVSMIQAVWDALNRADYIVTYNGKRYDIPHINKAFIENGFTPPAPYKHIDLWETVKREFNFTYNSLSHVCSRLNLPAKSESGGFQTWVGCMNADPEAWEKMVLYNQNDIPPTKALYRKLIPWIRRHPSFAAFTGNHVCPSCGSSSLVRRGYAYTSVSQYQRYVCRNCGGWSQSNKRERGTTVKGVSS